MKIFALAWLLVAGDVLSATGADVKRFDLNGESTLTIAVAQAIRVQFAPAEGGQPAHLILSDTNKVSEMRMVMAKSVVKLSDDQMKSQLLTAGQRLMSAVVEKEIKVQALKGSSFTYFYFELTDSRPDPLQGSRYVLQGLGRSPEYMCEFVMLTNRKNGEAKDQILNALRSLDIRTKK
ncbi:MAG TPA: hypothetical protein VNL17_08495 [Verrucomicrobiae bacterium]|nr:hypothetical protein [Verrucomicrobiae bacterium]